MTPPASAGMEPALAALIGKTAALMEQFERRCEALEQRQSALTAALERVGEQVPAILHRGAHDSMQHVPAAVLGHMRQGLERAVADYETRLRDGGQRVEASTQALHAQLHGLARAQRHLAWKALAAAAGALLILLLGGAWLATHYRAEIRRNQLDAAVLRAYNRADVQLCGERLCANVDMRADARGAQGQYRPVRPRP